MEVFVEPVAHQTPAGQQPEQVGVVESLVPPKTPAGHGDAGASVAFGQ